MSAQARTIDEQLRATISDGRALLKDFRQAIRDADELTRRLAHDQVEERVGEHVREAIEELGAATRKAMNDAVDKVGREFDRLADLFLKGKKGEPSIEELITRRNR